MTHLEGDFRIGATILIVDGEILESGLSLLVILGSCNYFSGATGLVSCGASLGVFLWLLTGL